MTRRLGIAQALINDPEFLILDEPTSGLDPLGTRQVKDLLLDLKGRGKTILLSSHLLADVDRLDADIREQLTGLSSRRFYVMHAAFGYFARDYGLQQVAVESGSREPDPRQIAQLIERAKRDGVRVLFGQPQFAPRHAELIASEIGARLVEVDPLARDWMENLRSLTMALRQALA